MEELALIVEELQDMTSLQAADIPGQNVAATVGSGLCAGRDIIRKDPTWTDCERNELNKISSRWPPKQLCEASALEVNEASSYEDNDQARDQQQVKPQAGDPCLPGDAVSEQEEEGEQPGSLPSVKLSHDHPSLKVEKVCPDPSELCRVQRDLPCPVSGCSKILPQPSALHMHLSRHHNLHAGQGRKMKTASQKNVSFHYHCPVDCCPYSRSSERFFMQMKYLKQHYLKVHAEKSYICEKCRKGFSTDTLLNSHLRGCGVEFCCSCGYKYSSYEALQTHARRNKHTYDEKYSTAVKSRCLGVSPGPVKDDTTEAVFKDSSLVHSVKDKQKLLKPKLPSYNCNIAPKFSSLHVAAAIALSELSCSAHFKPRADVGTQTDTVQPESRRHVRKSVSPARSVDGRALKRKTSTETQTKLTGKNKRPKVSSEAQTSGDYILKRAMGAANLLVARQSRGSQCSQKAWAGSHGICQRKISMETQTAASVQAAAIDTVRAYDLQNDFENNSVLEIPVNQTLKLQDVQQYSAASCDPIPDTDQFTFPFKTFDVGLSDFIMDQKTSGVEIGPQTHREASYCDKRALIDGDTQTEICQKGINDNNTQTDIRDFPQDLLDSGVYLASEPSTSGVVIEPELLAREADKGSCGSLEIEASIISPGICEMSVQTSQGPLVSADINQATSEADLAIEDYLSGRKHPRLGETRSFSIETQTDTDLNDILMIECQDTAIQDDSAMYFSTETQTTEDFSAFDHIFYSSMCTQTNEEMLFADLNLSDIETQTTWTLDCKDDGNLCNSSYVSAETQTAITSLLQDGFAFQGTSSLSEASTQKWPLWKQRQTW